MVSKKDVRKIIGIVLTIVGIGVLLYGLGLIPALEVKPLATLPTGEKAGIKVFALKTTPLAMVKPGSEAIWKVTIQNTGTSDWDSAWLIIRILKENAQVIKRACSHCPEGCTSCGWTGNCMMGYDTFLAEKCDSMCDSPQCREDICSVWELTYKTDGTWFRESDSVDCGSHIGNLDLGRIPAGSSKTVYIKVKVPSDLKTSRTILIGARAYVGGTYIIDDQQDTIDIFGANLVITFLGVLSLVAGLGMAIWGFR